MDQFLDNFLKYSRHTSPTEIRGLALIALKNKEKKTATAEESGRQRWQSGNGGFSVFGKAWTPSLTWWQLDSKRMSRLCFASSQWAANIGSDAGSESVFYSGRRWWAAGPNSPGNFKLPFEVTKLLEVTSSCQHAVTGVTVTDSASRRSTLSCGIESLSDAASESLWPRTLPCARQVFAKKSRCSLRSFPSPVNCLTATGRPGRRLWPQGVNCTKAREPWETTVPALTMVDCRKNCEI